MTANPISQDMVVNPALTVDSLVTLSGLAVLGLGPASERHVEEPGDPVLCGRLQKCESLKSVGWFSDCVSES